MCGTLRPDYCIVADSSRVQCALQYKACYMSLAPATDASLHGVLFRDACNSVSTTFLYSQISPPLYVRWATGSSPHEARCLVAIQSRSCREHTAVSVVLSLSYGHCLKLSIHTATAAIRTREFSAKTDRSPQPVPCQQGPQQHL